MSQAIRISSLLTNRAVLGGCAALLLLSAVSVDTWAITIVSAKSDIIDHNITKSSFFTTSADSTVNFVATDEGWFPKFPTKAGEATSTTPKKTYAVVGTSTAAGNWVNNNGIPTGITLNFTAEFTITALPLSGGSYLTNPGPGTGNNNHGAGIGVTQTFGPTGIDDIDAPDGIQVSATTISNVGFTGTLTDPNFTFAPGGVSNYGTRVFRSNNFDEATAGMLLTQGSDTIGFGQATGSIASNLIANNNFGTGTGTDARSSIFARQVGPYTLVVTQGVSVIKGIGVGYDVTFDITAVPVPPPGDYNKNGVVDAADYVLWRKGDLSADGNGDTVVDQTDYEFWRARFGNASAGAGSGGLTGATVPEPASAALLVWGLIATCSRRRRGANVRTADSQADRQLSVNSQQI